MQIGKDPMIVCKDADLKRAAAGAVCPAAGHRERHHAFRQEKPLVAAARQEYLRGPEGHSLFIAELNNWIKRAIVIGWKAIVIGWKALVIG
jgi:hypothetical protein